MKLKTLFIIILILVLIAIIGGETYYIIQNNNIVTQLSTESNDLKRSLAEVQNTVDTKEKEKQNLIAEQEAEKEISNKTKEEEKKKEEASSNKISMKSMVGTYKAKIDFTDDTNPGKKTQETVTVELILSSDGTYQYEYGYWASAGEYGNWFIDNNGDIVLNRVFCHSSDAALRLNRESKKRTLKIKDEKTLQDMSKLFEDANGLSDKDIILNKESSKTDFSLYERMTRYKEFGVNFGGE